MTVNKKLSPMNTPELASIRESDTWNVLVRNWKAICLRLSPVVAFVTAIAVLSYWGSTPAVLTGLLAVGLVLLVVLGYVTGVQTSLVIKALSLPLLVIGILLVATELVPTGAFQVVLVFAAVAFGLTLGKVID